jgi:superfamily II DNA or RNA helicase
MWLTVGNLYTKLEKYSNEERAWLSEYLSFNDARARYANSDARVRMFNSISMLFPTGFIPTVRKAAKEAGIAIETIDKRAKPVNLDLSADLAWLRPYQHEAVMKAASVTRGIIWAPTGAGKTEVFAGMTRALDCRWLFLVHRGTLVEQAAERYERRTNMTAGRIGEGRWEGFTDDRRVVAATFQTMFKRLQQRDEAAIELIEAAEGIVVDECHTLPADSFWSVIMRARNAYYRIGLSGTPLARGDKRSLLAVAALGPVIYRIKPDVLIEAGVLAKPKIRMVTVEQDVNKPTWQGVYGEAIVRSKIRNKAIVEMVKKAEKPCLVFVKEIKHGKELMATLQKAGINTEFVWGAHSIEWRKSHIDRLVKGHFDVLIASVIFNEGVDIPELRSVIIASGGASVIAALQRIGRGMRVTQGKAEFQVFDVKDVGSRWLEKHSKERLKAYLREGYEVVEE